MISVNRFTCSLQRQRIQAIETEIEGYRKSISKAQEQNEQITLMHNKIEADISMVKKLISISRTKQETLKTEYSKYTRTLHETEQQLGRAQTVGDWSVLTWEPHITRAQTPKSLYTISDPRLISIPQF